MAQKFRPENTRIVKDAAGNAMPNARLSFYRARTLERIPLYSDPSCTVPATNPVHTDQFGQLPDIYVQDGSIFDVHVHDCHGVLSHIMEHNETTFEGFPHFSCITQVRAYTGPSHFVYLTDECGRLALYRRAPNSELGESLPTRIQGVNTLWVGGLIITEFDLASYLGTLLGPEGAE